MSLPSPTCVAVTGGCGFIGARLVTRLAQRGHDILVIDDMSVGSPDNLSAETLKSVTIVPVDICHEQALAEALASHGPAVVFHLAAVHFIPACEQDPADAIRTNVEGTQSLLSAVAGSPAVEAVVVASSGAVYAPSSRAHTEDSILGPTDIYGYTKLWTEQLASLHQHRTGRGVGIARLFNVVGPGETSPHLIPAIMSQLDTSSGIRLGNLNTSRDYVYVDDVARGLEQLGDVARSGQSITCNFGAERGIDGHGIVRTLESILGRDLDVTVDSSRIRASDRPHLLSDCRRAHQELGWRAGTDLSSALREALQHPLAASLVMS